MRRTLTASLLSTILLGSIFTVARADTTVRLGVGTADITFHIGAGQGGWGERWRVYHTDSQPVETNMYARLMRSTEGVHMNQRIKAFVFDDGTRLRAVLSNDLLGSVQYFHRAIADQVARNARSDDAWDHQVREALDQSYFGNSIREVADFIRAE